MLLPSTSNQVELTAALQVLRGISRSQLCFDLAQPRDEAQRSVRANRITIECLVPVTTRMNPTRDFVNFLTRVNAVVTGIGVRL